MDFIKGKSKSPPPKRPEQVDIYQKLKIPRIALPDPQFAQNQILTHLLSSKQIGALMSYAH